MRTSAEGPDQFESPDKRTRVTVTSFESGTEMDAAKRDDTLHALVDDRRAAEARFAPAGTKVSDPVYGTTGSSNHATYEGADASGEYAYTTRILVSPRQAWTVFIETPGHVDTNRRDAKVVIDSIVIAP
jgi:hypothetical protein